mgnify:CR=1 FL=1
MITTATEHPYARGNKYYRNSVVGRTTSGGLRAHTVVYGARHILDDHFGFAGNMFRQMAREQPRPAIIKSPGGEADNHSDLFALVVRLLGVQMGAQG